MERFYDFFKAPFATISCQRLVKRQGPEILTNGGKKHKKKCRRIAVELLRDSIPEVVALMC